jgi:undecaprenyl-diphosphatase
VKLLDGATQVTTRDEFIYHEMMTHVPILAHGKARWQKVALAVPAVSIAVLIAFSRLYLGAHWVSDVIASVGLGLAWIGLLCIAYLHHVRDKPIRAMPMAIVVFTVFAFFGTLYAHRFHERDLARYAKPAATRTLTFDGWRSGEWRGLPAARSEFRGEREEPFTVQWVADLARVRSVLERAQWHAPPGWESNASMLWLIPATPVDQLPVLPKFHQGQPPALTFVHAVDARKRFVVRLWRVASVSAADRPFDATALQPLWAGVVTAEQSRTEFGLVATARTIPDSAMPLLTLIDALHGQAVRLEVESASGTPVLLVW